MKIWSLLLIFNVFCQETSYKRLFSLIFARHIETLGTTTDIYYSKSEFSKLYEKILNQDTPKDIYNIKKKLRFSSKKVSQVKFKDVLSSNDYRKIYPLLSWMKKNRISTKENNYFKTPLGRRVLYLLKDRLLIFVSGYGSHVMDENMFPEMTAQINDYYGRPILRPKQLGAFQAPEDYYQSDRKLSFDMIQPVGNELGNTTNSDQRVAKRLEYWINSLPKKYADKKLWFLGYSKGINVILELLSKNDQLRNQTEFVLSVAGTHQGAVLASPLAKLLKDKGKFDLLDVPKFGKFTYGPLRYFLGLLPQKIKDSGLKDFAKNLGLPWDLVEKGLADTANALDSSELIEGISQMTPYYRAKWAIENYPKFKKPIGFISFSVLTDLEDYLLLRNDKYVHELVPQFQKNDINWKEFSFDSFSLITSGFLGFSYAPGGLYDTQVAWADAKSFLHDHRPLTDSISLKDLEKMQGELTTEISLEKLKTTPRKELISSGIEAIDLGELRGNHWSVVFNRVISAKKILGKEDHTHLFPRNAFMRALLETLALIITLKEGHL